MKLKGRRTRESQNPAVGDDADTTVRPVVSVSTALRRRERRPDVQHDGE